MRNLSILLIAVSVMAAACSSASADQSDEAGTPPTTVATPATTAATTTAAAPDATATVTYDGPGEFAVGPLDITYVNDSDQDVGLHMATLFSSTDYGQYKTDMLDGRDVDPLSITVLWLNRGFEGLENRGEMNESLPALAGKHAPTCVKFGTNGPSEWFFMAPVSVTQAG